MHFALICGWCRARKVIDVGFEGNMGRNKSKQCFIFEQSSNIFFCLGKKTAEKEKEREQKERQRGERER